MHCKAQTLSLQMISMFFVVDQGSGLKNMISNIFAEGARPARDTLWFRGTAQRSLRVDQNTLIKNYIH